RPRTGLFDLSSNIRVGWRSFLRGLGSDRLFGFERAAFVIGLRISVRRSCQAAVLEVRGVLFAHFVHFAFQQLAVVGVCSRVLHPHFWHGLTSSVSFCRALHPCFGPSWPTRRRP